MKKLTIADAIAKYKAPVEKSHKRFTLKHVNKEIQKEFPFVELVKGEGYYYLIPSSIEAENNPILKYMVDSSVYIYRLCDQPIERWMVDVRELISKAEKEAQYANDWSDSSDPNEEASKEYYDRANQDLRELL